MTTQDFINFYKPILNFSEEEWSTFINTLSIKLPSALRITPSKFKEKIKNKLTLEKNKYFEDVYDAIHRGSQDRNLIINQTNVGNIQRQEVVSMLPVNLMDLKSHHSVLDMCAAPGSKTKQLLEIAHTVVANDCSSKRLNVLVTETCKFPRKSYLILKHDASALPVFKTDFDRVLCDVPCSGDGTARKNPLILDNWKISGALGLANLQVRILKHSFKFVKDNGLVIYSTCSLNPIENEWIVHQAFIDEDLEIVDLRSNKNFSPDFILREGISEWAYNDEIKFNNSELKKCIRVYPHDNNTGGFFIVGLRKKQKTNLTLKSVIPKPTYFEIDETTRDKLKSEYTLNDEIIVHRKGSNTLYEVSKEIFDIMSNSRLNVIYCGYKKFEKCDLTESGYRMKINCLNENKWDLEISGSDCVKDKSVRMPFRRGSVVVRLSDFNILIGGYSFGQKINLYISNNLQKALLDFIEE